MIKTVVTITGIRPDFIRMSSIFKLLDQSFNHILIHTGQHYDDLLSGVFFKDLEIREPDYVLKTGKSSSNHYEQLSYLSVAIINLFKEQNIKPDIVLFLGDSNSVTAALPLKKEGYRIGHIEAGMRSYDKRMLEEINRTVCDHCSDVLFVYHQDYAINLYNENIKENVYVVGNTIVEVCKPYIKSGGLKNKILVDIHRPENFKYHDRMVKIIKYANECVTRYNVPVYMLKFPRLDLSNIDIGAIQIIDLMSYKQYLEFISDCVFLISDSGTAQEEPALLGIPVVVPRDFTERPQSVTANCSYMLDLDNTEKSFEWLNKSEPLDTEWLGDGKTGENIVRILNTLEF